jgi:hypothetical protein
MPMGEIWKEKIPFVEVCCEKSEIAVPVLISKLNTSKGPKAIRIAQALAFHGSDAGAQVLYQEIMSELRDGRLPVRKEEIMQSEGGEFPPGQAAMTKTAFLIFALAMTKSPLNIPVWNKVAEYLDPSEEDFYSQKKGIFYYIDAVCYGANLIATKDAVPALIRMHQVKHINSQSIKAGIEKEFILERRAMLELIIGRSLARSGSPEGYKILIEYLDDMRGVLAEFAHLTLGEISGAKMGKNKKEWNIWLSENINKIKPVPQTDRQDG